MTPEERAQAVYDSLDWIDRHVRLYPEDAAADAALIAAAIHVAVAEEREACAVEAELAIICCDSCDIPIRAAAAIRAHLTRSRAAVAVDGNTNMLIQLPSGDWLDPRTVTSIRLLPGDRSELSRVGFAPRVRIHHGEIHEIITVVEFESDEDATSYRDQLAGAVNEAQAAS